MKILIYAALFHLMAGNLGLHAGAVYEQKTAEMQLFDCLESVPHLKLVMFPAECLSAERYAKIPYSKKAQLIRFAQHVRSREHEKITFLYGSLEYMLSTKLSACTILTEVFKGIGECRMTDCDGIIPTLHAAEKYFQRDSMDHAIRMLNRDALAMGMVEVALGARGDARPVLTDLEHILRFLPAERERAENRGDRMIDIFLRILRRRYDYLFLSPVRDDEFHVS